LNPADRYYTKEHEWIKVEEPGIGIIGITDHAQCELGDVVYVELPDNGTTITYMEKMGEIESVKAVSDLFSPVTAEVLEQNEEILTSPEKVNEDPFGSGWLVKVKLTNESELEKLMNSDAYTSLTS